MDQQAIEAAYTPFVAALREGGFSSPSEGWPPELIAAHVCLNNNLIAEAAEGIIAGGPVSYDNQAVVDDAQLGSYARSVGGLLELADAVEVSAERLATAWSRLDKTTGSYMLPVVILHAGTVIRDGPVPIREFIEGNASFHLAMHLEQLLALRPVT